ncbi:hypothetical protein EJ02DRAFT_360827 [Clathrospora elynae]|uniref:Uncharacterized protein n=1 Tax=Clathrospora elynae TaxID=706981 RepID=A0A6A5S764_9PLEO|nr:hypothetical protein EJ02DRAFT_360827 [Clathrospora elynae]
MSTPSPRPDPTSFGNTGPPGAFLRQLLNDIHGRTSPTPLRIPNSLQGTPRARPYSCSTTSRPASSAWVGGNSIAQDAREKLRVADEARFQKTKSPNKDYKPGGRRTFPRALGSQSHTSSSSPGTPKPTGFSEATVTTPATKSTLYATAYDGSTDSAAPPRSRPVLARLQIPSSRFITQASFSDNDIAGAHSPLMFCDSDISSTPSPSEDPTSAVTVETDATSAPESASCRSASLSPGKRGRASDFMPQMMTKRLRTMTFPKTQTRGFNQRETGTVLPPRGISGDNRRVIRDPAFIERAPAPMVKEIHPGQFRNELPELSSFRPDIANSQGSAPARPITPFRAAARRASMPCQSPTPEPAETPPFARRLHLMDTSIVIHSTSSGEEWVSDYSIYKNEHGEEWKQSSLCLQCFRRYGSFNRILTYGYEVCGCDEMLDSHYWEGTSSAVSDI